MCLYVCLLVCLSEPVSNLFQTGGRRANGSDDSDDEYKEDGKEREEDGE